MPARPPLPPGAWPPWFPWFAGFPEGKVISGTFLTQSVGRHAETSLPLSHCLHVSHCLRHQFGIAMVGGHRELWHVKIDRPIGHIAGREEGEEERSECTPHSLTKARLKDGNCYRFLREYGVIILHCMYFKYSHTCTFIASTQFIDHLRTYLATPPGSTKQWAGFGLVWARQGFGIYRLITASVSWEMD